MRHILVALLALPLLVSSSGCGSSGRSADALVNAPSDPVARVVFEFLTAVKSGQTEAASARLTPLALKRTSELELNFSPPGSATASFRVGAVEMIDADKAVVESTWTDLDADGKPYDEKITWALKLNQAQWRISGMAADMGEQQPPVVMDFENPGQFALPANSNPASQPGTPPATPRQAQQPAQDPFRTDRR